MERVTATSLANYDDLLQMAGSRSMARKAFLYMSFKGESIVFRFGETLLGIAFFVPASENCVKQQVELCMAFLAPATKHIMAICRFAHLILKTIEQTGTMIFCHVEVNNRSGRRLAILTGFSQVTDTRWERNFHVGHIPDGLW